MNCPYCRKNHDDAKSFNCRLCDKLAKCQGRHFNDVCRRCEFNLMRLKFKGIKVCYNGPVITVRNDRYDPHHHNGDGIDCFCNEYRNYIGPNPTQEYLADLTDELNRIRDTNRQ